MKKLRILNVILVTAVLLCGCGQKTTDDNGTPKAVSTGAVDSPDNIPQGNEPENNDPENNVAPQEEEPRNAEELVEQWMADETKPESIVLESTDIDEDATPLTSFEYLVRPDYTVAITKFIGDESEVVISSHVGEATVTEISQYAFEGASHVQSIQLPDTITEIGEFAFIDCSSLETINIPEGVTELFRGAFAMCTSLTEFTIPEQVIMTHEELFSSCQFSDLYIENADLEYRNWGLEDFKTPCTIHAPKNAKIFAWAEVNTFPTEITED